MSRRTPSKILNVVVVVILTLFAIALAIAGFALH